ncbi:HEAT repeat domain-containing protein [Halomicronema sp. CCY15110]|uniref:HEAT repeat domain-containing protein n=1 Tax=Halomicronema sp. CCY15110 TaxID=2767773 RepID=UPI001950663D|nr:HEAT repeat domain-containing protein [Halomicronema sp. CCY15110]
MRQRRWWRGLVLALLTVVLVLGLSSSGHAQEEYEKPKLETWQHKGIMAALKDSDPLVWAQALGKLADFDLETLSNETVIPQKVYEQIVDILHDRNCYAEANRSCPPETLATAIAVLEAMGPIASENAPQLWALMIDPKTEDDSLAVAGHRNVRSAAGSAFGRMGDAATEQVPQIFELIINPDTDDNVRWAAISALRTMETPSIDQASQLIDLIVNPDIDIDVRRAALSALGTFEAAAIDYAPEIMKLITNRDEDKELRWAATATIGNMGEAVVDYAPQLTELIANSDEQNVRSGAAFALSEIGNPAADQAPRLFALIADPSQDDDVRSAAVKALAEMDEVVADYAAQIVELIANLNEDEYFRYSLTWLFHKMGESGIEQAAELFDLVANPDIDPQVSFEASRALGSMGPAASTEGAKLFALIANPDIDGHVRIAATHAFGSIGEATPEQVQQLGEIIVDTRADHRLRYRATQALYRIKPDVAKSATSQLNRILSEQWQMRSRFEADETVSVVAANALSQLGPASNETRLHLLNAVSLNTFEADYFRFMAYYLSDGEADAMTLIRWLGLRDEEFLPDATQLTHREAREILRVFAEAWTDEINSLTKLDDEWPRQIASIVEATTWTPDDLPLLRQHHQNLKAMGSTQAAAVSSEIATLEWWRGIWIGRNVWMAHALFWLALVFIYPRSPQVQAIFFWNPWMRRIFGAGYVGFALTWVPFLRARLFAPFQDSLLADAGLAGFTPAAYFPDSTVETKATGEQQPLQQAIPAIKGQVILEGESGLGKTMFLRHLIQRTLQRRQGRSRFEVIKYITRPPRTMVFLPADRCADGVSEAIQVKLHGLAKDPHFLRDLIYSGAIDICIDGLNEVTADTRAKITEFVERYFKGNIIMTTQPLEWRPPATATTYKLNPLRRDKIQAFLVSREPTLSADAPIQGDAYIAACQSALEAALHPNQPAEELTAARRILSNPMDLSLVAQMIANKEPPNLFQLQQQQYKLMAADYQQLHLREFPLAAFSQQVYDMRLQDHTAIPEAEFFEELQCMERHKMVTRRQGIDNEGQPTKEWNFRHDKVMEFFIVQTFLGKNNDRPQQHMSDPRFRGVYFLLAKLMPIADALALREELIDYAADTRDHTVSDDFVQLLRSRRVSEAA